VGVQFAPVTSSNILGGPGVEGGGVEQGGSTSGERIAESRGSNHYRMFTPLGGFGEEGDTSHDTSHRPSMNGREDEVGEDSLTSRSRSWGG